MALASKKVKIAPIFSSEGPEYPEQFMGTWLKTNPKDKAFESWIAGYNAETGTWKSNLEVMGGAWYSYLRRTDFTASNHITTSPVSISVCMGQSATFSVASSATNKKYYWMKDGQCLSDDETFSGTRTSTLTVNNVSIDEIGNYYCRVVGDENSFTSIVASLTLCTTNISTGKTKIFHAHISSENSLNVSFNYHLGNEVCLKLYDVLGKEAIQIKDIKSGDRVDVTSLKSGIYILIVQLGNQVHTEKIVKE